MQPLNLKNFVWTRDHKNYVILAITTYKEEDLVVYRDQHFPYEVDIATVSDFCRKFQATYQVDGFKSS